MLEQLPHRPNYDFPAGSGPAGRIVPVRIPQPLDTPVGSREDVLSLPHGGGDEARTGNGTDQRGPGRDRDITIPDLRLGSGIKVPTRDFR